MVIDVTDLRRVCYGIVGFGTGMAKFISSREDERWSQARRFDIRFYCEMGPYRVMEDVRPRKALFAAEYLAKFDYTSTEILALHTIPMIRNY